MDDSQDNQARFIHVISSPLTALRGAIDLLRQPSRAPSDPLARELIETLNRNCARLSAILEVLLQHSRADDHMLEIAMPLHLLIGAAPTPDAAAARPIDPPRLLVGAAEAAAEAAEAASAQRSAEEHQTVLIIGADPGSRAGLMSALTEAGYTVLRATDGAAGIDMARERRPGLVVLDLDLPELSAQWVAQVLREDPDTKAIPMIYAAGQRIDLEQLPPHVELLPAGAEPAALLSMIEQTIATARARAEQIPTLLIVDDDDDIRRIVTLRFQQDGYRVVPAATGAEALIAAQKQPFDLIILDLLLPDIDGLSVLGALRARTNTGPTPIILLSAKDSPHEKVRGLQLGADDYVTKPFSTAELQARVRAALRRHEREAGANPSTRLPGNIAIERALLHRINQSAPFAVCYADIDNFKAYNDTYSFLKGDAVIQQTAHVLLEAVEQIGNHDDFVGHIGGDDFVVITTPDRARQICMRAIASFDQLAPLFYDSETRRVGYIDALDRQGRPTRYALVSLSIGIVSTDRHPIHHVAEVAQRSVEPKKRAKELPGSGYVVEY
ncbi:MAG: response regulator [Kouleothrix sp.]|nr:response regulator [Kouleothrix sp.]